MKKLYFFILACIAIINLKAQVPTITSFNPQKGNPGKQITINGTNFSPAASNNIVYFGTMRGIIVSATSTTINVLTPVGATYGAISVFNADTHLYGFSKKYFIPTFSPKQNIISSADFLSKVDFACGLKPTALTFGDFNADGRGDIVTCNDVIVGHNGRTDYNASVFSNRAVTGTIDSLSLQLSYYAEGGDRPQSIAIGDAALTGGLGYVVAGYNNNAIFVYGSYLPAGNGPIDVTISDLDADGKPDIVTANALSFGVSIFHNSNVTPGTLSFDPKLDITTGFQPEGIATGDIDGDGKPDIVIANSNNDTTLGLAVLRNTSTPGNVSFASAVNFSTGSNARDVALADIDGDGKLDVVVTNQKSNSVSVLKNTAAAGSINASSLASKVDFATGTKPKAIAIGDLNGDGKPDIVITNLKNSNVSIYQNTAASGIINSGSLAAQITVPVGPGSQPTDVTIGDIDGDGRPDISVVGYNAASISILKNEPSNINFNKIASTFEERALQLDKISSKTSINKMNAVIFPNPAKDYATLLLNKFNGKILVTLTDVAGNKIWEKQNIDMNSLSVPLLNLPAGMYFVSINDFINKETLKLIKE